MTLSTTRIRRLNPIEEALAFTSTSFPLCVLCVLHLTHGPHLQQVQQALAQLQLRHPLLRAGIEWRGSQYWFRQMTPIAAIDCEAVERSDANSWQAVAVQAINSFMPAEGPLMRCWLVNSAAEIHSELIVCFHHAMVDAVSARLLLHELLSTLGGCPLPPPPASLALANLPRSYRGLPFVWRTVKFVAGMLGREWRYQQKGYQAPVPAHGHNGLLSVVLSTEVSRRLTVAAGRLGLSLNAVLMAAILQAVQQQQFAGSRQSQARLVGFADLRSFMDPPIGADQTGCFIALLPMDVATAPGMTLEALAAAVQKAIFAAGRRGDAVHMYGLSRYMMRLVVKQRNMRLGITALSFIGKLDLQPTYGPIRLNEVSAFVPTNRQGPGFSAFGQSLFGALGLHFTYLTAEISAEKARAMAQQVRENLEQMAKNA